jgi:hypothetical protein
MKEEKESRMQDRDVSVVLLVATPGAQNAVEETAEQDKNRARKYDVGCEKKHLSGTRG